MNQVYYYLKRINCINGVIEGWSRLSHCPGEYRTMIAQRQLLKARLREVRRCSFARYDALAESE